MANGAINKTNKACFLTMLLKFLLNIMGKAKVIAKEHGGLIFKVRLLQELFVCFLTVIYDANASTIVLGGLSSILEQIQLKIIKCVNRGQICNSEGVRFCIGVAFLFCRKVDTHNSSL